MLKKFMFVITLFAFLITVPVYAESMSQEEIDAINLQRQIEAENEIARVKAAAEEKAKNELDAAAKTAEAFAQDVERRKDALEDWVDDQRELAGLEPIYNNDAVINDDTLTDDFMTDEEIITLQTAADDLIVNEPALSATDILSDEIISNVVDAVEETKVNNGGISLDEFDLFCRIIEAEAPHEGLNGKIMVANVILNRVASTNFPNTITGVIKAPGQFSPVRSGKINRVCVTEETKLAVNKALAGENYAGNALYFRSAKRGNTFLNKRCIATSGGNNFYA